MEIKESKIIDLNEWENNKKTEQSGFSNNQTIREKILNEANNVVNIGREQTYGTPENNFKFIADMWSVYLGKSIYPSDVALMMVMLKIARTKTGKFHADNFVDMAGYAACAAELAEEENF